MDGFKDDNSDSTAYKLAVFEMLCQLSSSGMFI